MEKPKPKLLIDFAREVASLLGEPTSTYCCPKYAIVEGGGKEIALFGPAATGSWRSKNAKIIAKLKAELSAPATTPNAEAVTV